MPILEQQMQKLVVDRTCMIVYRWPGIHRLQWSVFGDGFGRTHPHVKHAKSWQLRRGVVGDHSGVLMSSSPEAARVTSTLMGTHSIQRRSNSLHWTRRGSTEA